MKEYKIEDLLINPSLLELNGYKKYTDNSKDKNSYIGSWQKCIRNDHGKAYFIDFVFNDNTYYYNFSHQHLIDVNPYNWEGDLQLKSFEEDMTINVKILFAKKKELIEIEFFCEKMFKKMQLGNYEYYSESDKDNREKEIKRENIIENAVLLELDLQKHNTNKKDKPKGKV